MTSAERIPPTAEQARKRLKRRYREEGRFRFYGVAAIVFAIVSLGVLLTSIVVEAVSAFVKNELTVEVMLDPSVVDPDGDRDPEEIRASVSVFSDLLRNELRERFPEAAGDLALRRQLSRMVSTLAGDGLAERAAKNPGLIGTTVRVSVPVADIIDLYLKGLITGQVVEDGAMVAALARDGEGVTVRAPGGFAGVHERIVTRVRDEASVRERAADLSVAAIARLNERMGSLDGERARLAAADMAVVTAAAEDAVEQADAGQARLARIAGRAEATGDMQPLRDEVRAQLQAMAAEVSTEATALVARGDDYARRAAVALARGEPTAETRRIQSSAAYLAGDRRRVDARVLEAAVNDVNMLAPAELVVAASQIVGRPLAPMGALTSARDDAQRVAAVMRVNAYEVAGAQAAIREQQIRIDGLTAEASVLRAQSPERADALRSEAAASANSRMNRLLRDLETLQEAGARLAPGAIVPAPAAPVDPAAPVVPADPGDLAMAEAQAQLGLDVGGPLAVAYALGASEGDGQGADDALRSLLVARVDLDRDALNRDIARLERKRDRDSDAARALLDRVASPGATLTLDEFSPSVLVEAGGGVVKARTISPDGIAGEELLTLKSLSDVPAGEWRVRELETPEGDRLVTDRQAAWANALKASGDIQRKLNFDLFTRADSTYPELAGLAAALAGSFWIMIVTLALSLPIGVMAAIYLEEFAPRNRITDFIEVNINNLAAVPSIVFGLLGAAVFINFFNLPRSAPLIGGLVLSLITLPTIIIATRAALGAVPPSIREGALAVGASLPQTVFHHVLPLAAPGILTGAIIGLARALGETAPLLLIGMVAFVAEPPASMFDSATALPVLVYKWSSAAERAWQPMTSAAIIVLLVFMFAMNALAVYLRRRLERRW